MDVGILLNHEKKTRKVDVQISHLIQHFEVIFIQNEIVRFVHLKRGNTLAF